MSKHEIDINNWIGKKHYEWFIKYPNHYYNITKQIDITNLIEYLNNHQIDEQKVSFFIAFLYLVTKSLNQIEEMRLRIQNGKVYLYDEIDPAYTIMTDDGIFENCDSKYYEEFKVFYYETKKAINKIKSHVNNNSYNNLSEFNQYYITCLPWLDFQGLLHPMPDDDSAYVPRICWGKYTLKDGRYYIAMNIQVSHALVDGYPLCKAFLEIEKNANNPNQLGL